MVYITKTTLNITLSRMISMAIMHKFRNARMPPPNPSRATKPIILIKMTKHTKDPHFQVLSHCTVQQFK